MARYSCIFGIVFTGVVSAFSISFPSVAAPVDDLKSIFGDPDDFVSKFETSIKDDSNQVVGLFIAATGFTLVVRSLTR